MCDKLCLEVYSRPCSEKEEGILYLLPVSMVFHSEFFLLIFCLWTPMILFVVLPSMQVRSWYIPIFTLMVFVFLMLYHSYLLVYFANVASPFGFSGIILGIHLCFVDKMCTTLATYDLISYLDIKVWFPDCMSLSTISACLQRWSFRRSCTTAFWCWRWEHCDS